VSGGPTDPHRIGVGLAELGIFSKRSARLPFAVIATVLHEGEVVEALVQGRFRGHDGGAVVTASRVVLANDREWKPDVVSIPLVPGVTVQGWQDERAASLVFTHEGGVDTIDQIGERELAKRVATVVRTHCPPPA
jgi:hypothetical protein